MKKAMYILVLLLAISVSFCIVAALNINDDKNIRSYTGDMTYIYLYTDFSKVLVTGTESTDSFIADSASKAVGNEDIASENEEDIASENEGWHKYDEKAISYFFFSNYGQWHYNLTDEMCAAEVICAYAEDDSEEGNWELRSMHTRYTENYRRVLSFFACSEDGRELYMLLDETHEAGPEYLVMADVMVDNDGSYSYESSLHWKAYGDVMNSSEKYSGYSIYTDGNPGFSD